MSDPTPQQLLELAHQVLDLARAGDAESLGEHIDSGVPVDLTDSSGNTLVMLAAQHGHAAAVTALATRGADVNRLNDRGRSPLAGAVLAGEDAVVAALLEAGADPDAGTPTARSAAEVSGRMHLMP